MPSSMSSSGLSSSGSSSGLSPMSGLQTPGLNICLDFAVIGMSSPSRTRKMGLSSLGMVSTSPLRSSGGKGGAMGAGHDADVDAVAVADRDDDAIDAFDTSGSNVLPAFGPARTRGFFAGLSAAGASMPSSLSSSGSSSSGSSSGSSPMSSFRTPCRSICGDRDEFAASCPEDVGLQRPMVATEVRNYLC